MLLQLQQLVILQGQLDVFQFPHWFLEFGQLQVQEQGVYHVLVVVLECHELFPPYKGEKSLITKANEMHYFSNLLTCICLTDGCLSGEKSRDSDTHEERHTTL